MKVEKLDLNRFVGIYYRKTQIYMKKAFKGLGVSFEEGVVLLNVFFNPNSSQDRIAAALVLDAAAVARSLKSLEHKEYLTRVIDVDNQRRKLVRITPAGIELAKQMLLALDAWDNECFKGLDEDKKKALVESIHFLQSRAVEIDISALIDGHSL